MTHPTNPAYEGVKAELIKADVAPLEAPRALLLSAQQGSGKSTLLRNLQQQFPDEERPVVIDRENLREKHPRYGEICRGGLPGVYESVSGEIFEWMQWLLQDAIEARLHAVIEATLDQTDLIAHIAKNFNASGYQTEIYCLAVPRRQSMLGMFLRCEEGLKRTGATRWPVIPAHDQVYESTAASLNRLAAAGAFKQAFVHRLDGTLLHHSNDGITPETIQAIENERNRTPTGTERSQHLKMWRGLSQEVAAREGPKPDWYVQTVERELQAAIQNG